MKSGLWITGLIVILFTGASALELPQEPIREQFANEIRQSGSVFSSEDDESGWGDEASSGQTDTDTQANIVGRKSPVKAAALSALLPGLGQRYNGRNNKATYFFAAEAVTWLAFGSFRVYGSWREDDYIDYGNVHANAQLDGKSDEFLDWVGFYDNIDQYNTAGRVGDPDRPYLFDTPENHWEWQSTEAQRKYRDLKNSSREAFRRADFMIAVAVINRVVSMVDAVLDTRKINRQADAGFELGGVQYDLDINPMSRDRQVTLSIYPGF